MVLLMMKAERSSCFQANDFPIATLTLACRMVGVEIAYCPSGLDSHMCRIVPIAHFLAIATLLLDVKRVILHTSLLVLDCNACKDRL